PTSASSVGRVRTPCSRSRWSGRTFASSSPSVTPPRSPPEPPPSGNPVVDSSQTRRSGARDDPSQRVHEAVDILVGHRERARTEPTLAQDDSLVEQAEEHAHRRLGILRAARTIIAQIAGPPVHAE